MTVREFCMKQTQVKELVVIKDCGWIVSTAWIDYEDIFRLPEKTSQLEVISDEWGTLDVVTEHGDTVSVPCHYINAS